MSRIAFAVCMALLASMAFVGVTSLLSGCSWLQSPQGANGAGLAAKDIVCVLQHDSEKVSQIVSDCNLVGDVSELVQQVLAQAHSNEAQARLAACFPVDAGVPGK